MDHHDSSPQPPAIIVAGPPHSGKSVFLYQLNWLLRGRDLHFYHLGAAPDGEGHWSQEVSAVERQFLRRKGEFTPAFVAAMTEAVKTREIPLLVDVGGRISEENRTIMTQATHAIILSGDPAAIPAWEHFCRACGLQILAILDSVLEGEEHLEPARPQPPRRGQISGLERGSRNAGPVLQAIADEVATLFATTPQALTNLPAPICDLAALAAQLNLPLEAGQRRWTPADLPRAVASLPPGEPVALYNSGPLWLYAALLLRLPPEGRWCYNPRTGWHRIMPLPQSPVPPAGILTWTWNQDDNWLRYERPESLLPSDLETLAVPTIPTGSGIVLDGRGPNWLIGTLSASYPLAPWIGLYVPMMRCAIIVREGPDRPLGSQIPLPASRRVPG